MALPKKKSRSIQVQGQMYRWMVRATENDLILTVQHHGEGQLLQVPLHKLNLFRRMSDATWTFAKQGQQITPWLVRQLIETAQEQGWQSATKNLTVFAFREIAWEHEYFFYPYRMRLEDWLDPLVIEDASREQLTPVVQLAMQEIGRIADFAQEADLDSSSLEFADALNRLAVGESIAVPDAAVSQAALDAGLTFSIVHVDSKEKSGHIRVQCNEFLSAAAMFRYAWSDS